MSKTERSEGSYSRFGSHERERGAVGVLAVFALGAAAVSSIGLGMGLRLMDNVSKSVEGGTETEVTDIGFGTVTTVEQMPAATRFVRLTADVQDVRTEVRGYVGVAGAHIEAPGDLAIIFRDHYGAEQWVDILVGDDGASITREINFGEQTAQVTVSDGAFSTITSEVVPGSGHNVRPGPLAGGYAAIAQGLESMNEDWDLGTNGLEGRVGGLAVMQAQRLASIACVQAAAPIVEEALTDSLQEHTAMLANQFYASHDAADEFHMDPEDVTVVLPDIENVTAPNQYEQYFNEAKQQAEANNNQNPGLSYRFNFPELPTGEDVPCDASTSDVDVKPFEEVSPQNEQKLEEAIR